MFSGGCHLITTALLLCHQRFRGMPRNKTCRTCVPALDNLHKHVGRRRRKAADGLCMVPQPSSTHWAKPVKHSAGAFAHRPVIWRPLPYLGVLSSLPPVPRRISTSTALQESLGNPRCFGASFQRWWKECAARTSAMIEHASRFCTAVPLCSSRCAIRSRQELVSHLSVNGVIFKFGLWLGFENRCPVRALFPFEAGKLITFSATLQKKDWY